VLALFADMWTHPAPAALEPAALDRYKATLVRADQAAENANALALSGAPRRAFVEAIFGAGHPLARHATEQSIAAITPEDIAEFRERYFHPQNATLILVGDVRLADALPVVEQAFADWKPGGERAVPAAVPPAPAAPATTIYLFDRPGAKQSAIIAGTVGPSVDSPDFVPAEGLSVVFGGTEASRLTATLRVQHGWTYAAGTAFGVVNMRQPRAPTTVFGFADVETAKTDSALAVWIGELRALRGDRPPTPAEARAAQAILADRLTAQMATDDMVADRLALIAQRHLPLDFYTGYVARVRALTATQLAGAAAKYLDPDHLTIVVYGDRKAIEDGLKATGIRLVVVR
jgi:zinc protease